MLKLNKLLKRNIKIKRIRILKNEIRILKKVN